MRQLADLAFLLQRYDFAESMYRLAAQDYLANGNNKWYAGAEVRQILCGYLLVHPALLTLNLVCGML